MIVRVHDASGARRASSPGDLAGVGAGATLTLSGAPRDTDLGRWASSLGLAVLRGASVTWSPA